MREALGALTNRGRAFIAAGAAAALCAIALGYPALVRVGVLLALLPIVTAYYLGRSQYRLGLNRTVSPRQVPAGHQARVELALSHEGRLPSGSLLLEEKLPYVLGTRPRFVLQRPGARWNRDVAYTVRSDLRGRFPIGPMTVRLADPFGLVELDRTFSATSHLVVTPPVIPLPVTPVSGAWTGAGDNRPRSFATGSAEDVTVREYRHGDDLRRVHWRSTAKAGELMVRREEQPWQSRATLFIDNRSAAHRGAGASSSFERAVTVVASVGVHLVERGFHVRLVTADGDEQHGSWHEPGSSAAENAGLLESLAVLTLTRRHDLEAGWLQETGHSGLLVGVFGAVVEADQPLVSRMRHVATTALGVGLAVSEWERRPEGPPAGACDEWLTALGFRAVRCGVDDDVREVWQSLSQARSTARYGGHAS